jgi:DNA-binding response OmpR family regulator
MSILLVEDDHDLTDVLAYLLRREGHEVNIAYDGASAIKIWQETNPQLILLDIDLPRLSGWDVCEAVREGSATPIVMLTGATSDDSVVKGLELGADDYLTKPFSPKQLLARIRAVLRRSGENHNAQPEQVLSISDLQLDTCWRRVRRGEDEVSLTKLEFQLLYELTLHAGQVLTYRYITDKVWGYKGQDDASLIKGHIRNLRSKLGTAPDGGQYIETVHGTGYVFRPDGPPSGPA